MSLSEENSTYFSVLQGILLDRHGDEILSTKNKDISEGDILINSLHIFNSTVYTWVLAILCSALVGLSGLLPVFFTPEYAIQNVEGEDSNHRSCDICKDDSKIICSTSNVQNNSGNIQKRQSNSNNNLDDYTPQTQNPSDSKQLNGKLKLMLSFAVGGLLGDVFLHLLPEAHYKLYAKAAASEDPIEYIHKGHMIIGLWILFGILTFIFVEMIFNISKNNEDSQKHEITLEQEVKENTSFIYEDKKKEKLEIINNRDLESTRGNISVSGYLNLMANCVDNFSHGLAVGGAFLIGPKIGVTTTLYILIHEIPHEIGDFAILIKSGFNRYDAARAQLSTASIGMCGALLALTLDTFVNDEGGVNVEKYTSWIIPFTCGGFINISLVTVLPDIMESQNVTDCLRTLSCIILGVFIMMGVSSL